MPYITPQGSSKKNSKSSWIAWSLTATFYMYQFFLRSSTTVLIDDIMRDFKINAAEVSNIAAKYYLGYTIMQLPLAILMDRLGSKRVLAASMLICVAGCYLFSIATEVYMAEISRFLIGLGAASGFLGSLRMAIVWFTPDKFAFLSGLTISMGMIGSVLGQTVMSKTSELFGWRKTMCFLSIFGFILFLSVMFFVNRDPSYIGKDKKSQDIKTFILQYSKNFWILIRSKNFLLYTLSGAFIYFIFTTMIDMWCIPFLKSKYNITEQLAISVNIMFQIGLFCGSPFIPKISDYLLSRKKGIMISSLGCLIFLSILLYVDSLPLFGAYFCLLMMGFFFSGKVLCFSAVVEGAEKKSSSMASALCNALVMLLSGQALKLFGKLMNYFWNGAYTEVITNNIKNKIHYYDLLNYKKALSIEPIVLILAVILIIFAKETHPKRRRVKEYKESI